MRAADHTCNKYPKINPNPVGRQALQFRAPTCQVTVQHAAPVEKRWQQVWLGGVKHAQARLDEYTKLGALVRNSYLSGFFFVQAGLYAGQYVHVSQQSIGFKYQLWVSGLILFRGVRYQALSLCRGLKPRSGATCKCTSNLFLRLIYFGKLALRKWSHIWKLHSGGA
jgi:hypothetical protein